MSKTRFIKGIVLACMAALAACTSGDGGVGGNTELIVVIPNNGPALGGGSSAPGLEVVASVEYTINCLGGQQPPGGFLPDNPGGGANFDDAVQINGNLEVRGGRTNPPGSTTVTGFSEVWQGFMDLPPGVCTVETRAKDSDGEVICTDTVPVTIAPSTLNQVSLAMICDVSFQAPVGSLDVDATFQFRVANFCPDLFVLNCLTQELVEVELAPGISIFASECQVRARDGDKQCGNSCDPQDCQLTADGSGLTCTPGPEPSPDPGNESGLATTVTCVGDLPIGANANAIDCDGNPFTVENSCTFDGDLLGTVGAPPVQGGPNPGTFYLKGANLQPGSAITCTAVSTDGDVDCDKTKVLDAPKMPGLGPCDQYAADGFVCDDGNDCTDDSCNDALASGGSCGAADNGACCETADKASGEVCTSAPAPAFCDGAGTCVSDDCNAQPDPDGSCADTNECTIDTCDAPPATTCSNTPATGDPCAGTGSPGDGTCDAAGVCQPNNECTADGDCPNTPPAGQDPQCTSAVCDTAPFANVCGTTINSGITCNFNPGAGDGQCTAAGTCIFAPPACGNQQATVQVGCTNSLTEAQSPFPFQLIVDSPSAILGGAAFSVTLDGIGFFPEFFLNAAQGAVPGGVKEATLVAFVSTVSVASGATGADVPLSIDVTTLSPGALRFCNFPADQTCTCPGGTPDNASCATAACLGGTCGAVKLIQTLPTIDGIPLSTGGCSNDDGTGPGSQLPPDCNCDPCAALDIPPSTTKLAQCETNGYCQNGDLVVQFAEETGSYTAAATGPVLWGWTNNGTLCDGTEPAGSCTAAYHVDGSIDVPPPGSAGPTFLSSPEPIGIRVQVPGLNVPIQCAMGADGGSCSTTATQGCLVDADCPGTETCIGVGVDDDIIMPVPDADLISCPVF